MRPAPSACSSAPKLLLVAALSALFVSSAHAQPAPATNSAPAWHARWIAAPWSTERDGAEADGSRPMPVFRREFSLSERPTRATLRLAGMGQWQATLTEGGRTKPVVPPGLHQDWTDYRKTITYRTIDLTPLLSPGEATLTVLLGNGMYNVQRTPIAGVHHDSRYTKFVGSFGPPKLTAEIVLEYPSGRREVIETDSSWQAARGPVLFDSAYGGEDFDSRDQPGPDAWTAAVSAPSPGGELIPAIAPPVGQHERHQPVHTTDLGDNRVVYDLGINFAGVVHIRVQGPAGAILRLTPGELLNPDGTVSQATFHGPMWWSYILHGDPKGEDWEPLFGYGGFRYVQAEWTPGPGMVVANAPTAPAIGKVVSLTGIAVHSDAPVTGTFESSSTMLNQIHALIVNAMHNNTVSLLTDCPHREKLGWLEQTHLQAATLLYNNDLQQLFRAQDRNMADAQWANGIVPTIAPEYTRFGSKYGSFDDSPEWGSASILEPWWVYRFYGDRDQLALDYPVMQRYLAALQSRATDGIVAYGLGDWYDIGPGSPGFEKNTSLGLTATLMLFEDARAMAQIANLLGHPEDAARYTALATSTADAFNRRFWDPAHNWYDRGSQTANAMPLALGVVPPEHRSAVLAHVVADIHAHKDHVTAGEIGYPYLLRALSAAGRDDVVLAMMLRQDPPSYGSQLAAGATALTEAWDANTHSSQDHFMLGAAEEWFYRALGGIDLDRWQADPAARIRIAPRAPAGLDWVRTSYHSPLGPIRSDWKRIGSRIQYTISVPANTEATVVLPHGATVAGGKLRPLAGSADGETTFHAPAGDWVFTAPAPASRHDRQQSQTR